MGIGALTKHHRKHPHHQHTQSDTHSNKRSERRKKRAKTTVTLHLFKCDSHCQSNANKIAEVRTKVAKTLKEENSTGNICFWPLFIRVFIWHVRPILSLPPSACPRYSFLTIFLAAAHALVNQNERQSQREK